MVRPAASLPPLLLLLPLLGLTGGRGWAEAEAPAIPAAIEALAAPGEATRRAAVEALVRALPASRTPVIEALGRARPEVQVHLIEVLGRDGSPPAVRALLEALKQADPLQATRIRHTLVRREDASRRVLEAWAQDPALRAAEGRPATPEVLALEAMLRRAEAERLFLARKSRTGGTGSYRGQFADLEPYREEALALCVAILRDRAIEEPGVFTAGRFEFLRPPDRAMDMDELTGMASHAFGELARPSDGPSLVALDEELRGVYGTLSDLTRFDFDLLEPLGRYTDLLIALHRVLPQRYEGLVALLLRDVSPPRGRWSSSLTVGQRANLLLRVGRYEEALGEYGILLERFDPLGLVSDALTNYNMACAYAQWGESMEGAARERRRRLALEHLERAVQAGWSDVGWLDEDRDLDPIRDTEAFRAVRQRAVEANIPPEER